MSTPAWLADAQAIAIITGRAPATIRSWAHRGLLARHGTGPRRRTLYSVTEAEQLAARLDALENPVTLCNTEPVSGSMP
jgi:hypothetical protein